MKHAIWFTSHDYKVALEMAILAHDIPHVCISEKKENIFGPEPIPYKISPALIYPSGIEFICKGKHQYRYVKTEVIWQCQCGRTI